MRSVRLLPGSSPLTVPPTVKVSAEQVTVTSVTASPAMVPPGLDMPQVCVGEEGWVSTVTRYSRPSVTAVAKVKLPLPLMVRLSPPLFCSTSPLPVRPATVPPTV